MSTYRSWQEPIQAGRRYEETRIMSIFPLDTGFLITMRGHMRDGKQTFGHGETTFFASFEQAQEIADTLLTHIQSKVNVPDTSSPDDSVS